MFSCVIADVEFVCVCRLRVLHFFKCMNVLWRDEFYMIYFDIYGVTNFK